MRDHVKQHLFNLAIWVAPEALEGMETISQGQAADLRMEDYVDGPSGDSMYLMRWWLNRVGPEDGARFRVEVEARSCPNGTWESIGGYGSF